MYIPLLISFSILILIIVLITIYNNNRNGGNNMKNSNIKKEEIKYNNNNNNEKVRENDMKFLNGLYDNSMDDIINIETRATGMYIIP